MSPIVNHNACAGSGRPQPWHLRFPCYAYRLVRMAEHCRTEEFAVTVGRLTLINPEQSE